MVVNWSIGFLPVLVVVLILARVLTKSWVKTGHILQILFSIVSILIAISWKDASSGLLGVILLLSLGLLISGIIGLSNKKR